MQITKKQLSNKVLALCLHGTEQEISEQLNFFYNIGARDVSADDEQIETPITTIFVNPTKLRHKLVSYYTGIEVENQRSVNGELKLKNPPINCADIGIIRADSFLNNIAEETDCQFSSNGGFASYVAHTFEDCPPANFSCNRTVEAE